ncbi:MAG: prepilin-type N-terminal cleavage/methylation domain-containing protein [Thiotrichales bacterium]|nr:prepilin-type N-terminal cleavage/methylation domain-containing protein [Thiotrichales bacterium]
MKEMCKQIKVFKKQTGFSLIELAVVLAIIGVVAAGSVGIYSEQRTHVLWQEGDTKLSFVKSSLLKYVRVNKFMPCPDTNGNGFENRTGGLACSDHSGTVPFNELGLTAADVQDSWGNALIYAVNQSTTDAVSMADCPANSACFFNNTAPPMFNLTTLPIVGNLGVDNLRVCNVANCSAATAGASINGDALIAVLVATNENGDKAINSLDTAEKENRDGDAFFVQANYSETPYYDDLLITISANEIKDRYETEIIALEEDDSGGPQGADENPFDNLTVDIAGGNGDDDRFADEIGVNIESGTLGFGSENAGKTVTLTFKAKVTGGWEDADALNEGVAAETSRGKLETQDKFIVGLNSNVAEELYTIAEAADPEDGRVDVDLIQEYMGNPGEDQIFYYDENDDRDNTWYEYASYNVELDENGELKVDFAVFSTAVSEKVQVSDVEAVLYTAPTAMPTMPEMTAIPGIPQTDIFK